MTSRGLILPYCFALPALSYTLTAVLILVLKLPTSESNLTLKAIYLLLYCYTAIKYLRKGAALSVGACFLIAFFSLYTIRLIWDQEFLSITFAATENFYVYAYFLGATVAPCIALLVSARSINREQLLLHSSRIVTLANIGMVAYLIFFEPMSHAERLASRANIQSARELGTEFTFINPILIGQIGATAVIINIGKILYGIKRKYLVFQIGVVLLGIYSIAASASRGPLLFATLSLLLMLLHNVLWFKNKRNSTVALALLFIIPIGLATLVSRAQQSQSAPLIVERVANMIGQAGGREREARDDLILEAWQQFLKSPIIGDQFVLRNGGGYPHNVILEVLMATGVLGAALFFVAVLTAIVSCGRALRMYYNPPEAIMLAVASFFFLSGLTSGSIFVNPEIWVSLALAVAIGGQLEANRLRTDVKTVPSRRFS